MEDSKHSKRSTFYCPCVLSSCKGKHQKILKKTIQQHFEKCGQEMVTYTMCNNNDEKELIWSKCQGDNLRYPIFKVTSLIRTYI